MTPEQIAKIEAPRTVHWWGDDHEVSPRVLRRVFGDGTVVKALIPLATRPNYYIVRVGPEWASADKCEDGDVEDVLCAIEDEYGCADSCHECPDDCPGFGDTHNVDGGSPWPALDTSYGWMFEDVDVEVSGV